jgi:glutathione S-transferase
VKSYGFAALPDVTSARREVKRLTGEGFVPVLVLDDGEVIAGSKSIVAWAGEHPATDPPVKSVGSRTRIPYGGM